MSINKNATIIDVRTTEEFALQHVPGAINIPLDQISARIEELKKLPKPITAYCRTGNRSGVAVSVMKQHGITDVVNGGAIGDMLWPIKR